MSGKIKVKGQVGSCHCDEQVNAARGPNDVTAR